MTVGGKVVWRIGLALGLMGTAAVADRATASPPPPTGWVAPERPTGARPIPEPLPPGSPTSTPSPTGWVPPERPTTGPDGEPIEDGFYCESAERARLKEAEGRLRDAQEYFDRGTLLMITQAEAIARRYWYEQIRLWSYNLPVPERDLPPLVPSSDPNCHEFVTPPLEVCDDVPGDDKEACQIWWSARAALQGASTACDALKPELQVACRALSARRARVCEEHDDARCREYMAAAARPIQPEDVAILVSDVEAPFRKLLLPSLLKGTKICGDRKASADPIAWRRCMAVVSGEERWCEVELRDAIVGEPIREEPTVRTLRLGLRLETATTNEAILGAERGGQGPEFGGTVLAAVRSGVMQACVVEVVVKLGDRVVASFDRALLAQAATEPLILPISQPIDIWKTTVEVRPICVPTYQF